jgi:hypothetical protein
MSLLNAMDKRTEQVPPILNYLYTPTTFYASTWVLEEGILRLLGRETGLDK